MTEPQVWVLIGVFAAALIGILTLMSTMFLSVVRAEIRSVHTRIDHVGDKIDRLDADISVLTRHTFGIDRD